MVLALEAALGSGELRVDVNNDRVIYRSIAELREALAYFRALAASGKTRTTFAAFG
jgi:hypothetical protein